MDVQKAILDEILTELDKPWQVFDNHLVQDLGNLARAILEGNSDNYRKYLLNLAVKASFLTELDNVFIVQGVAKERQRQDQKFGLMPRNLTPDCWLTVLTEEIGEVFEASQNNDQDGYENELIQVAAVAVAALEDFFLGSPRKTTQDVCPKIKYGGIHHWYKERIKGES